MADSRIAATSSEEPKKRTSPANKPMPNVPGTAAFKVGLGQFLREAWVEVTKKTTWPTRPELIRSTSVVLAAIIAVSLYLFLWDVGMANITERIFTNR